MNPHSTRSSAGLIIAAMIAFTGCQSTPKPNVPVVVSMPPAAPLIIEEGEDIAPPRSEWELIEAANDAFTSANAAHETQDSESALRHYTQMFELLIEAELDPELYYGLRDELSRILSSTTTVVDAGEIAPQPKWDAATEITLRSEIEFPDPLNLRVMQQIDKITNDYPKNFQAGLNRSAKYLPYIREQLREAELPEDLAWLAMVESQFTPRINSRVGAGGMWQFMKGTGRRFDLQADSWVDERYDWKKSTRAAIAYLGALYEMFDGSWPLAVSAYNKGENGLERAIAANGGDSNFWRLIETPPAANRLPRETKNFYPKLLATIIVTSNLERYGMSPSDEMPEETAVVSVEGSYSLRDIERSINVAQGTLRTLNPQILRGLTPPGRTSEISVPASFRTRVASAIKDIPKIRPATHVVQKGETLSEIAKLYKVSLASLTDTNNIRSAKRLQIGQRLAIPGRTSAAQPTGTTSGMLTYTVRAGDTPSEISQRYGLPLGDFLAWNNMDRKTPIYVGDTVYVTPQRGVVGTTPTGAPTIHVVAKNEFLGKIASDHGVALNDLLTWNSLDSRATLSVGQKLKLYPKSQPAPKKPAPPKAQPTQISHKVRSGESASVISSKYGVSTADLLRWNGLKSNSVLQVGQTLKIQTQASAPPAITTTESTVTEHVVSRGQSPWTIAKRYSVSLDDLFRWNGWKKAPVLQVGDKIVIQDN